MESSDGCSWQHCDILYHNNHLTKEIALKIVRYLYFKRSWKLHCFHLKENLGETENKIAFMLEWVTYQG